MSNQHDTEQRYFLRVDLMRGTQVWARRETSGVISLMHDIVDAEGMNETEILAAMDQIAGYVGFMIRCMEPVYCELKTYLTPEQRKLINV